MTDPGFRYKPDDKSKLQQNAQRGGLQRQEPIKENYRSIVAQRRLRRIFDYFLGTLQKINRTNQFVPKAMKRIDKAYIRYIAFYDGIGGKDKVPFLPLLSADDVGMIFNCALQPKPSAEQPKTFTEFLEDYQEYKMPPYVSVDPDKMRQMARLYYELQEIDWITHRFRKLFENAKSHYLVPGSLEYKSISVWINWLLEVYPVKREPLVVKEIVALEMERKESIS